jgi:4-hydroxy-tetrahydrodipicolinate synthase
VAIAHVAHRSARETVELTRHAEEVGADFAILMKPYYPPANEEMFYEWLSFVASRVDIGIRMFDAAYSGHGLSPELTARIADIENVCAVKNPRPMIIR